MVAADYLLCGVLSDLNGRQVSSNAKFKLTHGAYLLPTEPQKATFRQSRLSGLGQLLALPAMAQCTVSLLEQEKHR
jgi:hypothetical protein